MQTEKIDAKRLKMVKTALIKLREVASLLDQVNINNPQKYSVPVVGISYNNGGKIVVQFSSVETMQQIHKPTNKKKLDERYNKFFYDTGKLRLIALEDRKDEEE